MRFTSAGLLGKFATTNDETTVEPNRADLTRGDLQDAALERANGWRSRFMKTLSCFELEGEYGLYQTIGAFVTRKPSLDAELQAAAAKGDLQAIKSLYFRAFCIAFITLLEKGALKRLMLVNKFEPEVWSEIAAMRSIAYPTESEAEPAPVRRAAAAKSEEDELQEFAKLYLKMPASDVRKYSNAATNPEAHIFVQNVENAAKAGLI